MNWIKRLKIRFFGHRGTRRHVDRANVKISHNKAENTEECSCIWCKERLRGLKERR